MCELRPGPLQCEAARRGVAAGPRTGERGLNTRSLIFDLDGTLVDSYAAIASALNAVLSARKLPQRTLNEVRLAVGRGLEDLLGNYLPPDQLATAGAEFGRHYGAVMLPSTHMLPGAETAVRALHRRGYGLAVASNKPVHFSREILEHLDLLALFRSVRGPEPSTPPKPHPAMLGACLADLGVAADEALYVGDMVLDVETGRAAGVRVALVATGSCAREELEATGQRVYATLEELAAQLDDPGTAGA